MQRKIILSWYYWAVNTPEVVESDQEILKGASITVLSPQQWCPLGFVESPVPAGQVSDENQLAVESNVFMMLMSLHKHQQRFCNSVIFFLLSLFLSVLFFCFFFRELD